MSVDDERIREAVQNTEVLRAPKQHLSTFGTTSIHYYLVTEPAYGALVGKAATHETVIREGRVIAEKPRIVTPYYLTHVEGFSSGAKRYLDMLINRYGPSAPGLFYSYRNEPQGLNLVSEKLLAVVDRLNMELDQRGDPLVSIIRGVDELWDVALLKFISELTRNSVPDNMLRLGSRGLLDMDASGVPRDARVRIEELFTIMERGGW
ncbi:MAG: hypothetical protein ABIB93_05830 [Chloroflexota bacterium]